MVARLGAGLCIACKSPRAKDAKRRRYHAAHQPTGRYSAVERADREAMRRLLIAAGDALGVD
jgi:hypothetical protein